MPRTPLQYRLLKSERRKLLFDAALKMCAVLGLQGLTTDDITNEARCSHGLFYHYYDNVESIIEEVLTSEVNKTFRARLFKEDKHQSSYARITAVVTLLLNALSEGERIIACALIAVNEDDRRSLRRHLIDLVRDGQDEGDVTGGEPKMITSCFLHLYKGLALSFLQRKKDEEIVIPPVDLVMNIFRRRNDLN